MAPRPRSTEERFWSNVDIRGPNDCWPCVFRPHRTGYCYFRTADGRRPGAHVVAYEMTFGPVPEGLILDHECHTDECPGGVTCPHRKCCNPAHLVPKPGRENTLRSRTIARTNQEKTHCVNGHEFTPENTYRRSDGNGTGRRCKACKSEVNARYNAKKKAA